MKSLLCFLFFLLILILPSHILATEQNGVNSNQFITIVNPVRISTYSTNPQDSLAAQYFEVKKRNLAATWLLNHDLISDSGVIGVVNGMDESQEIGLFLEITPKFATAANVIYNKTDSWHRANSVFLSGYTQEDRIHLIDEAFRKFKEAFGYYPVSVGAWWIDSFSLDYMQKKYGITANLNCADQFSTDGYEFWGQFWSVPFYPSKLHAGMPASNNVSKLDIVTIQWAARDPLNAYGRAGASLYSVQDKYEIEYFKKLVNLYARSNGNKFGQMTVGLEGDFPPQSYGGFFASQLEVIKEERDKGSLNSVTMKDFSKWYRDNFPGLSPVQVIKSNDFLGKEKLAVWYNSPKFRIHIVYDYEIKETVILDFRTYHDNFQEPYYVSPNRDLNLTINLPSIIDSVSNPEEKWKLQLGELENLEQLNEEVILNYKNANKISLTKDGMKVFMKNNKAPSLILKSSVLDVRKTTEDLDIKIKDHWNYPQEGFIFRDLTQEATYFLKQRKTIAILVLTSVFLFTLFLLMNKKMNYSAAKLTEYPSESSSVNHSSSAKLARYSGSRIKPKQYKFIIMGIILLLLAGVCYKWYLSNTKLYFVSQAELDSLNRLKLMPGKRIVIFDKTCLQCDWHTPLMPAIFANKRDYIKKITGKQIVYNSSIFNAKTRPEAKKELDKLNADYIYLVRFENYVELAPFSPGDLNIEDIYSNANTQIWKVKKN